MTNRNDGIFTQPGPNGIFGRGGTPDDPSSPPIDGDGTPLRETLLVAYPSPGHMRVARAIRHAKTGKIEEYQEQFREPTPDEVAMLKEQGLTVGPGSMVLNGVGDAASTAPPPAAPPTEGGGVVGVIKRQPWIRIGMGVAVGVAGFWAVNKYVFPIFGGKKPRKNPRREEEVDEDDEDDADA